MGLDIFHAFNGRTALIFANTKSDVETYADFARKEAERRGLPDCFRVHHGSLSKGEREDTEDALRSDKPTATFCSSTLEMGIDVGNVEAVGQIGTPWTVSSMRNDLAVAAGSKGRHRNYDCTSRRTSPKLHRHWPPGCFRSCYRPSPWSS